MGLVVGDGHLAGSENPSLAFLFRAWIWPAPQDWPAFLATGLSVAIGGLLVSQAYRMCEAAVIAPFEYAAKCPWRSCGASSFSASGRMQPHGWGLP